MATVLKSPPRHTETELVYVHRRLTADTPPLAELSCVRTLVDAVTLEDDTPVPSGSVGTIVTVHDSGIAYDVEIEGLGVVSILARHVQAD